MTSKTQISAYKALKVPEVWCHNRGNLQISVLQDGSYVDSLVSPTFPDFPVADILHLLNKGWLAELTLRKNKVFRLRFSQ